MYPYKGTCERDGLLCVKVPKAIQYKKAEKSWNQEFEDIADRLHIQSTSREKKMDVCA